MSEMLDEYIVKEKRIKLKGYRQKLRSKPTQAEREFRSKMSRLLKHKYRLSFQKIFYDDRNKKGYIVDFYIHKIKMIIEVDGAYHNNDRQKQYDADRTRFLNAIGIYVFRITNEQVFTPDIDILIIKEVNKRAIRAKFNELCKSGKAKKVKIH